MTPVIPGENQHVVRRFFQADGVTPLLRSALASLSVELRQGSTVLATYVFGTAPQLAANPGDTVGNEIRLELTTTLSAAATAGLITEVWKLQLTDAAFIGGEKIDRIVLTDFNVKKI